MWYRDPPCQGAHLLGPTCGSVPGLGRVLGPRNGREGRRRVLPGVVRGRMDVTFTHQKTGILTVSRHGVRSHRAFATFGSNYSTHKKNTFKSTQ